MSAIISPCGQYRYRLDRDCGLPFEGSKVIAYFGINPSTADATLDDQTVRKWRGFTIRNGGHRFIVGNVFAYRATDVDELVRVDEPFGLEWREHLIQIIAEADILVPCWGRLSKIPRALRRAPPELMKRLIDSGKPVLHFGVTKSGDPLHPLLLPYETPLTPWSAV
ncbi:hypothetical protein C1893_23265 [Pseudomonas sp. MPR-ANC1]|uniref:DUF1643 domain-containing protein n=1 Tax=Pseudomonas sp. MPR-ANC1 TaxID=2075548 RepID=UPI000CD15A83|nr:DUF1643 domain-containing protein [Pseudomonas sp. MPR-ANC1]POA45578.1 hypothetical protein C1893_23265 [Pseudomonas sp. MPR-ANC1]